MILPSHYQQKQPVQAGIVIIALKKVRNTKKMHFL